VGFDGEQVFATARACISLVTQSLTVDLNRLSRSYENRLVEYARRGHEIFVPDLIPDRIDPSVDISFRIGSIDSADLRATPCHSAGSGAAAGPFGEGSGSQCDSEGCGGRVG
jgi:hypothetical protein